MGDLIQFATWPQHQYIFYKITSGGISFSVRGERHAAIGLARRPGEKCDYWIILGYNQCWIEKDGSHTTSIKEISNNTMMRNRFTNFWLSWHNRRLQFGRPCEGAPLLSKRIPIRDLQYVTFSVYGDIGTIHWKLYLPPKLEKPLLKNVTGGEMQWVQADEQLPNGAMIGGYENELLYIIRAPHSGSLTPGKFVPSLGAAFIPWGGEMHEKNTFEVLCGYNCIWVTTSANRIPVGALEAGYSEDNHETLYIGRAVEKGYLIPGKVQPSHSVCYIPYNGHEVAKKEFEILVNPQISNQSPNRYFVSQLEQMPENRPEMDDDQAYSNELWHHHAFVQSSESNDEEEI